MSNELTDGLRTLAETFEGARTAAGTLDVLSATAQHPTLVEMLATARGKADAAVAACEAVAADLEAAANWTAPLPELPGEGRYRSAAKRLFQAVGAAELAPRVFGGVPYKMDRFGPTHEYVDPYVGWAWDNPGGDWVDVDGEQQGPNSWGSVALNGTTEKLKPVEYRMNLTRAVNHAFEHRMPLALKLSIAGAPRAIAGLASSTPPRIEVVYEDGSKDTLACWVTAACSKGMVSPLTQNPRIGLPAFLEFDGARARVVQAELVFTVIEHWSGRSDAHALLLNPSRNTDPVQPGVAALAGPLDLDIEKIPSIIGAHRYLDGSKRSAFISTDKINIGAEREFDPAIWGRGPRDTTLLPHRDQGKWINASDSWELVDSTFKGDGFEALAPGLGALRVPMKAGANLADGSYVGYGGTLAANGFLFLPEELFGRLGRIFVRHYFRLGHAGEEPYQPRSTDRLHVFNDAAKTDSSWTDVAGKFGIMPEHTTSAGGVSGSAGGGAGWQMRMSWSDCDAGQGGPDEGGWSAGYHLYDFYWRNPKGHNYSGDSGRKAKLGQRGGLGGILYAKQWYCMESEVKLNTVMPASPGFLPDGELRTWIDGRLAFERTGMVFRTLPVLPMPYSAGGMRPCRELGVRGLWFNWFHGGKTQNVVDRTIFVTGLAWGKEYIGPMNQ